MQHANPGATRSGSGLKQQAYAQLKQLIQCDDLPAGSVQSVRQLAARLNMSKTPVHAAIERLEAEGLVTLAPQQGVVVREMSLQDIVNHFEIRQALEPYIVRRLAGRLTDKQIELLRENLDRHREASVQMRALEFIKADAEFHQLHCRFLGNEEIARVMSQLRDKVERVVRLVSKKFPERFIESYDEHLKIFEAMVGGDGEHAAELANEHLAIGLQRFCSNRRAASPNLQ